MRSSEPFVDGLFLLTFVGAAISFLSSAQFHRQAAEMGADSQPEAQAQFDAGQQTIREEGYSRTVVSEIELMGEFSA